MDEKKDRRVQENNFDEEVKHVIACFSEYKSIFSLVIAEKYQEKQLKWARNPRKMKRIERRIYLYSIVRKLENVDGIYPRILPNYKVFFLKASLLMKTHTVVVPNKYFCYFPKGRVLPRSHGVSLYPKLIYLADSLARLGYLLIREKKKEYLERFL